MSVPAHGLRTLEAFVAGAGADLIPVAARVHAVHEEVHQLQELVHEALVLEKIWVFLLYVVF